MSRPTVGVIVVSHSSALAAGVVELAAQMAPDVTMAAAGGTAEGGLGTSFDIVAAALRRADTGAGAVLLYDLGSSVLTAEMAVEVAEPARARRIVIVDAPMVEGTLAAAVAAQGGADLAAVAEAARGAGPVQAPAGAGLAAEPQVPTAVGAVRVVNPLGLHARPAAALARAVQGLAAVVTVTTGAGAPVDVRSVLRVVTLGVRGGAELRVNASGPDAVAARDLVTELVAGGFGEIDHPAAPVGPPARAFGAMPADGVLTATPGAPGLAIGPLRRLGQYTIVGGRQPFRHPRREAARLDAALAAANARLLSGNEFAMAHAALLTDPDLRSAAAEHLEAGAAHAWWAAVSERADEMAASPDEVVAARAADVREAGAAVLTQLEVEIDRMPADVAGQIVLTEDLGPTEVTQLVERGAAGAVVRAGSPTAHAVIVARGLALPLVLRVGRALDGVPRGMPLAIDGTRGTVVVDPDAQTQHSIRQELDTTAAADRARVRAAVEPVFLADGRRIAVGANVGSLADARAAVAAGADTVGLLRTELLVLDRLEYPDEDRQTADLAELFAVLGDRPIVVRVLDAGGDKPLRSLPLDPVRNGFLGVRGLRYLLANPRVLHTQLRAICRAAPGYRVSVMAPMVTVAAEMRQFRAAVTAALASLAEQGVRAQAPLAIGAMIEVPAAAPAADEICAVADFLSVGSNDLTSYTNAAERTLVDVADLLDPGATASQRLLDQLCAYAVAAGTPIAVCGEIAGMRRFAPGLVARGVHELSMAPALIPGIKELLRESVSAGREA